MVANGGREKKRKDEGEMFPYFVFGWGEFREDGKHREKNKAKNSIFHCLAKEGKWGGRKTREKILSEAHNFHPPKSGEKSKEKNVVKALLHKYPLTTSTTTQRGKISRRT